MTMRGFLFDRSFMDFNATMNLSKHLTRYYSLSTQGKQTEMTALSMESTSISSALDLMNSL